jgi:hypothetical protein
MCVIFDVVNFCEGVRVWWFCFFAVNNIFGLNKKNVCVKSDYNSADNIDTYIFHHLS